MGRIIFSLFILWGYLSISLGGSRPGSFPLRGYVPPLLSSWCDTLHSSQIIAHSPHRARHQPQDQNTNRTPTEHPAPTGDTDNSDSDPEQITSHTSRTTAPENCRRSCAALWETNSHQPPGVRFLLRKRTHKYKHVCV